MNAVEETQAWVSNFVVKHGLCPFAAKPMLDKLVRFVDCDEEDTETVVRHFLGEVLHISEQSPQELETTLLVYTETWEDFDDFLAFIDLCEDLLEETGAADDFQLAHFHPNYCFVDTAPEDVTNRTNRSPLPTLQILRTATVAEGIDIHPDAETIWQANVEKMEELFGESDV